MVICQIINNNNLKLCILAIFILLYCIARPQNNYHSIKIYGKEGDTLKIEYKIIDPSSIVVKPDYLLSDNFIKINYVDGYIVINKTIYDSINISYRTLEFNLSKKLYKRKRNIITVPNELNLFEEKINENITDESVVSGLFNNLDKQGSFARGISFGNNQDVIVNSSFNLQLSGYISDDVKITSVITDNNIPIQPDGTTQQIQDFDKVFIELDFQQKDKLIAGDIDIINSNTRYLSFNKKAKGISYTINDYNLISNKINNATNINFAISKGKYAKNIINPIEGNQGPYKLKGSDNETYITVLAATERVYVDGQLVKRGQDNDYIIDYNTAEITFTPNMLITKDKRIIVEFEYSNRDYARSTFLLSHNMKSKSTSLKFDIYNESDMKNQPVDNEITNEEKIILQSIGDKLNSAYIRYYDSSAFNSEEIRYKKIDTLGYQNVFVYNTDPNYAFFKPSFTYVGSKNGNYIVDNNLANGKVYRWVSPINGVPQGDYEPIKYISPPVKKQVINLSVKHKVNNKLSIASEFSQSNNDVNTFSKKDNSDNIGYAGIIDLNYLNKINEEKNTLFTLTISNEFVSKHYSSVERFREIEFNRNWNINSVNSNQFHSQIGTSLKGNSLFNFDYIFDYLNIYKYNGFKNEINFTTKSFRRFTIDGYGSYLNTYDNDIKTAYIKLKPQVKYNMSKFVFTGFNEIEKNRFTTNDSLLANSFFYYLNGINIAYNNTSPNNKSLNINVLYSGRKNMLPENNMFKLFSYSDDVKLSTEISDKKNNRVSLISSYRNLKYYGSSSNNNDENISNRVELMLSVLKKSITANSFYETGSGMETKKEYVFMEVAKGRGTHIWNDYNNNGIKEINEFEIASFQADANFIKLFLPSNDYEKVYYNQFSNVLSITPSSLLKKKSKFNNILNTFSAQSSLRLSNKIKSDNIFNILNPVYNSRLDNNSILSKNYSLKNTLFFNRFSSTFSSDFNFVKDNFKNNLIYSNDIQNSLNKILNIRFQLFRKVYSIISVTDGRKKYYSQYMPERNFYIKNNDVEPSINFNVNNNQRLGFIYRMSQKNNIYSREKTVINKLSIEYQQNIMIKTNITGKFSYANIKSQTAGETSVAYELFEGLSKGVNYILNLSYEKTISSNTKLYFNYEGRKNVNTKIIQTVSVQFKMFF